MRGAFFIAAFLAAHTALAGNVRCDDQSNAELSVDGMLDDWKSNQVLARIGVPADGAIALKCSWDGSSLGLALDIADDRVVRVPGTKGGHEDRVDISLAVAGGKPIAIVVYPGNALAREKILAPAKTLVADSLQPNGFSIEAKISASRLPGFSPSTPAFELRITFHDSDQAAGGDDTDLVLATTVELGDKKDLLDDFLREVRLKRGDVKLDAMAELDPDRKGKERLVAGGTVIGVLTDQFAYVTLPVPKASDVREVKLLPLGSRGLQVVEAIVRQSGHGGSRDLLMLWTVWSGQLQPLGQIEVRKQQGPNVLEAQWVVGKGRKGPELVITPKPAVGWTAGTWNEEAASDADPILLPWDTVKGGTGYALRGHELERRDVPAPKRRR
ncbi:MAG: hypothetical protein ABJE66_29010 [Deltaproteobacteria bacterium]